MLQTSHIAHGAQSIWCTLCGEPIAVKSIVLRDPHRTLEAKENFARRHRCKAEEKPRSEVRVMRPAFTESKVGLDRYWQTALAEASGAA
ncbi:hypothetical protein DYQ86_16180 [Acidobacteria bacterium AB60]|nr:hypothetical protein DYQ86_16180 [Acidobacteria bacterium AB60]